jgi:hypothetical protein
MRALCLIVGSVFVVHLEFLVAFAFVVVGITVGITFPCGAPSKSHFYGAACPLVLLTEIHAG